MEKKNELKEEKKKVIHCTAGLNQYQMTTVTSINHCIEPNILMLSLGKILTFLWAWEYYKSRCDFLYWKLH